MTETIETLLDAAESGVRTRGYHAVSFRDLAEELGIKSSSVHYYFRQKQDLGLALVERYAARFFAALNRQAETARSSEDRIRAYCEVYRQALTGSDQICLCGMLGAESFGLPAQVSDAVAAFFKANINWLENALPGALSLTERLNAAVHILATLQGAMVLASNLKDHQVFDNVVQDLMAGQLRATKAQS